MKAVQIHKYGGRDELVYEDALRPVISEQQVLVKIYASGVNPVDWKIREGKMPGAEKRTFPIILGWDMSGTIEEIGDDVHGFKLQDSVFGKPDSSKNGTYAEYIAVSPNEIALKPLSIDYVAAASLAMAGLTAWQGLFDCGKLKSGERILINGAAGGVGTMAVQLAKLKGAYVVGTASENNNAFLKGLGADQVIDYHKEGFLDELKNFDLVFDVIGGETQNKLLNVLKPGGTLVSSVGIVNQEVVDKKGLKGIQFRTQDNPDQLMQISKLIDEEKIKHVVEYVFPLKDAKKAHEISERGHTRGKIVLQIV
jgi:NADPH:quinone reductase-like Zn-dependent oxidoreductase